MCHFSAMCVSIASSFPRRGPGVPFADTEPLLFGHAIGHIRYQSGIPHWLESVSLSGASRKAGLALFTLTRVCSKIEAGSAFTQAVSTVSYGQDVFLVARWDLVVGMRQKESAGEDIKLDRMNHEIANFGCIMKSAWSMLNMRHHTRSHGVSSNSSRPLRLPEHRATRVALWSSV